ncbi:hypothetical protein EU805_01675 [Salipiger sp. IMCC34102]|uniref:hypothetical protein n=1 Tax=Salipiger sp. IMCC34102 TaxID=2510647 RepID=UPI00101BD966|nr:hypothetical protein [Salipiger sp. IMCC34102]RYH04107.1 hypothetical protein EU805_01675 [Salipiger sp. IMCC34102]
MSRTTAILKPKEREQLRYGLIDPTRQSQIAERDEPSSGERTRLHGGVNRLRCLSNGTGDGIVSAEIVDESAREVLHRQAVLRENRNFKITDGFRCGKSVTRQSGGMDYLEHERRCRTTEITPKAIHIRLVAARRSTGATARQLASSAGIPYTTFKTQETAGSPSLKMLDFYWRAYQIDPNFIMGGDTARLLPDTISALLEHLDDPDAKGSGKEHG